MPSRRKQTADGCQFAQGQCWSAAVGHLTEGSGPHNVQPSFCLQTPGPPRGPPSALWPHRAKSPSAAPLTPGALPGDGVKTRVG
ncbi:hypothetical protein NHX12_006079 [Muraenolepis orangiensis]|uniref:Uncharacterized protein n=1 Tax=Muraenolepis orangiensis TaxID=630683 RepID=A0A9Q0DRV2_9TELE|nr:hypothetical protein NHX12_006079 [Muraenolepis orangiensis]